jgi:hypothetical protein
MAEYHAAVRGAPVTPAPVANDGKGTVGWLIGFYKNSRAWGEERSQETRRAPPYRFLVSRG